LVLLAAHGTSVDQLYPAPLPAAANRPCGVRRKLFGAPAAPDLQAPAVAVPVSAEIGITHRPYDHMTLANGHDVTALRTEVILDCPMLVHTLDLVALELQPVVRP
ncbi:MAG: hypothetical protein ACRDTT_29000, partial [Pseudonocardiaceae bacterium]